VFLLRQCSVKVQHEGIGIDAEFGNDKRNTLGRGLCRMFAAQYLMDAAQGTPAALLVGEGALLALGIFLTFNGPGTCQGAVCFVSRHRRVWLSGDIRPRSRSGIVFAANAAASADCWPSASS
jgi:hypothetical protein